MPSIRRLVYGATCGLAIAMGFAVSASTPADAHVHLYFGYGPSPYYWYDPPYAGYPYAFYGDDPYPGYWPYGLHRHYRHKHCGWVWVGRRHHRHQAWECWYR